MSTGYMLPKDGKPLRHGHSLNGRDDWHDAATIHHSDPNAHSIQDSWNESNPRWWKQNHDLPNAIKAKLIREAHAAHDVGAPSPSFQIPTPKQQAPSSGNGVIDADLLARIDDIETLSTAAATTSNAAAEQSDRLASQLTGYERELLIFKREIHDLKESKPRQITYHIRDHSTNKTYTLSGHQHRDFDAIFRAVKKMAPARRNFWIAGPAGSGKSYITRQIATALGQRYDGYGSITDIIQLTGYTNSNGDYVATIFYDFYCNGGVLFFDECDNSVQEAMICLNMALANGMCSFPISKDGTQGGLKYRHPNFYCFATANTMGGGATQQYLRQKQDDASMDRFLTIALDYDPILEKLMVEQFAQEWVEVVQSVRQAAADASGSRGDGGFLISPRASEKGQDLLRATPCTCDGTGDDHTDDCEYDPPLSRREVVNLVFGRYIKHEKWPHVGRAAEEWVSRG
ncbi:MAG: hypothetical protein EHM23_00875 [Acidobacteria bacterium]|nr:MAG: hypothetical protein EHM23_00875 [Acidobacteriota bacterium]